MLSAGVTLSKKQRAGLELIYTRSRLDPNVEAFRRLRAAGTLVHYRSVSGRQGRWETVNGRPCLMFASNDYLGLRWDPRTISASAQASSSLGAGSGGSRLMAGNGPYHSALEEHLADLTGQEEACVFTTGYQANLGAISALLGSGDTAFCDSGVHASLIDGCRLAGAQIRQFRRQRLSRLKRQLAENPNESVSAILTDAIYSMEGDILDFDALASVVLETGALLHVDEAHSIGVLGPRGGGIVASAERGVRADFVTGTLSKSFASCGGFVAGPRELMTVIRIRARSLLFSTASTPSSLGAALEAVRISLLEPERRQQVKRNGELLRSKLQQEGLDTGRSDSHIVPIYVRDSEKALAIAHRMFESGVCVGVAIHPAVPRSASLIRLSTTAAHGPEEIDRCVQVAAESIRSIAPECFLR